MRQTWLNIPHKLSSKRWHLSDLSNLCGQQRTNLQDGDTHEADTVVGQQLHFDGGGTKESDAEGANVRGHGGQSDLEPQLASQVEIRHQHRDLQRPGQCSVECICSGQVSNDFKASPRY